MQSLPVADACCSLRVKTGSHFRKAAGYKIGDREGRYRMLASYSNYGYGPERPMPLSGGIVARVRFGEVGPWVAREFLLHEET